MAVRLNPVRVLAAVFASSHVLRRACALSITKEVSESGLLGAKLSSDTDADALTDADRVLSGQNLTALRLPCGHNGSNSSGGMWVILYQTSMSLAPLGGFLYSQLAEQMDGLMQPEVIGMGTHFGGFSSKHHLAIQRLSAMDPDDLVILSDYADVLLNPGRGPPGTAFCGFRDEYKQMTKGQGEDAVVVSAEAQCCVGALSYVEPGSLIQRNSTHTMRRKRACNSGANGCMGLGRDKSWQDFMVGLAAQRGFNGTEYPFLNAGLMAGRAGALAKMLSDIQLDATEDDQAVMTDMLWAFPERFVLDYDQRLFGNARWPKQNGCVFKMDDSGVFSQTETGTKPLFLHTSGKFYKCLRSMAVKVGWNNTARWSAAKPGHALPGGPVLLAAALALLLAA